MNDAIENIPDEVFDWLQHFDFADLPQDAQETVLEYWPEAEYTNLRETQLLLQLGRMREAPAAPERFKEALLLHVNAHQRKAIKFPTIVWQAAAVVLFLISASLSYVLLHPGKPVVVVKVVEKRSSIFRDHKPDTVLLYATKMSPTHPSKALRNPVKQAASLRDLGAVPIVHANQQGISVLTPKDVQNPENTVRGNSLKDETLTREFSFVSL